MRLAPPLLGTLCLFLGVTGDGSSTWTAVIPSSVPGLLGSCVVIPCSFDYPHVDPKTNPEFTGIWADPTSHIAYHPDRSRVGEAYRDRVQLLGSLSGKNCSMVIDPVRQSDGGPFHFRIEIKDFNSYSYWDKLVSVPVRTAPEPITFEMSSRDLKVGDIVSVSCSVSHTCPTSPPTFTWTHAGHQTTDFTPRADGQWQARSWLGFYLTSDLHNTTLGCSVEYKGGKRSKSSTILLVKSPPLKVEVQQLGGAVLEGEEAELRCFSDGYPPALYWWVSEMGAVLHGGQRYLLHNVSRHTHHLYCKATNTLGQAQSALVRVNTTYPPEISQESSCSSFTLGCECVVESSPPAVVSLSGSDDAPLRATMDTQGSVTVATLLNGWAGLWSLDHIYCHASNGLGNTTYTLQIPRSGKVLMICGIATGVLLLIVMLAFGIKWKRQRPTLNKIREEPRTCAKAVDSIYANM